MSDRQMEIEEQRARMQNILRNCEMALMIAVDENGEIYTGFMNCTAVEVLGLSRALNECAPAIVHVNFATGEDKSEDL